MWRENEGVQPTWSHATRIMRPAQRSVEEQAVHGVARGGRLAAWNREMQCDEAGARVARSRERRSQDGDAVRQESCEHDRRTRKRAL